MNDLNESSIEGLFNYEHWIKEMLRKYKFGKQKNYKIGDKVVYFIHMYKASTNKLHAYEIECTINEINDSYNLNVDNDLIYKNISHRYLRKK